MTRRAALACASAALAALAAGCALPPRVPAPIPPLRLRLPPASLGRELALQQQLRVSAAGRSVGLQALLEADASGLRLALLALERPVARLDWDGTALQWQAAPQWPALVDGESLLAELCLALWPAEALAGALDAGWTLEHAADRRELRWQGQAMLRVRYHGPGRWEIEQVVQGYRIEVESAPVQP